MKNNFKIIIDVIDIIDIMSLHKKLFLEYLKLKYGNGFDADYFYQATMYNLTDNGVKWFNDYLKKRSKESWKNAEKNNKFAGLSEPNLKDLVKIANVMIYT